MVKEKKKKWYGIIAPKLLNSVEVGETYLAELDFIKNKSFEVNLMSITNDPKKQNINVSLLVNEIKDDKAYTIFRGFEVSPSFVRRVSKRARLKFDESFLCVTKDDVKVRIKFLVMFKDKLKGKTSSSIRDELRKNVCELAKKNDFEGLTKTILNRQDLQKELKERLSKIYPVYGVMVRSFNRL